MHPYSGNWVAIGRAVAYYAQASHAFSAGFKCRHCRMPPEIPKIGVILTCNSPLKVFNLSLLSSYFKTIQSYYEVSLH